MDFSQIPLRPIALPEAISWFPPAPGWWLLAILVLVLLVWVTKKLLCQHKLKAAKKIALNELAQIKNQFEKQGDQTRLITGCSALLKRTALSYFPREQVASLSGRAWLNFLLNNSKGCEKAQLECLVNGPYQRASTIDANDLIRACHQWIKTVHARGKHV